MGRHKQGYNWKSRQIVKGTLDNSETNALVVQIHEEKRNEYSGSSHGNDTNDPVLPSKKRRFKRDKIPEMAPRLLSKKRRKLLEKVVDQKKKKLERGDLLKKLESVQVAPSFLSKMTSLSSIQTKGLKKQFAEDAWIKQNGLDTLEAQTMPEDETTQMAKMKFKNPRPKKLNTINDDNVLGFQESSSSSESEEESDIEMKSIRDPSPEKQPETPKPVEKPPPAKVVVKTIVDPNPRKTIHVPVNRNPDVQTGREKLPIIAEEQTIMETINSNQVLVLAGETGSGKTTQVPQFLYEAGYASEGQMIGITQPRRVAALSMARRVSEEMNLEFGKEVGYQIRFEGNVNDETTKIKFMTDGVLLREIEKDFLLKKYSIIILDEAHERSVFTDILIGILSRITPKRNKMGIPLKLIIMSATLRIEDFTKNQRLFKIPPPVIKVESRQFDVTAHFNRKTPDDYVKEALKKVCKIHQSLPDGGILVFLTGQKEVNYVVKKLKNLFSSSILLNEESSSDEEDKNDEELKKTLKEIKKSKKRKISGGENELPIVDLNDYNIIPREDHDTDAGEQGECVLSDDENDSELSGSLSTPLFVLPLYSMLNSERQAKVFQPPPEGHRLCVISTNVAETSLTIPGIKYVVDTGKVKNKFYDKITGVSTYAVDWISRAQANQRAGRAGRTAPGHCYRLYSSAVFQHEFSEHSDAEILKRPVEDLVLQMKSMKLENVLNFPFPTPPDPVQIKVAENKLTLLGALESQSSNLSYKEMKDAMYKAKITPLGKAIAAFPLAPKFGKMLALSHQQDLLPYTISLVSALSVQEVLLETPIGVPGEPTAHKSELASIRKIWAGKGHSYLLGDPMVLIRAVGAAEYSGTSPEFCNRYGLRHKAVLEIRKLRRQLTNETNLILPGVNVQMSPNMTPPSQEQAKLLRQIILAGLPDQIGEKIECEGKKEWKYAYKCGKLEEPVFLHSCSVLRNSPPTWIVYQEIFEAGGKMYMRGVTAIEKEWISIYAGKNVK